MVEKLVKEIDNARVMSKNSDIRAKYEGTLAEAVRFIQFKRTDSIMNGL